VIFVLWPVVSILVVRLLSNVQTQSSLAARGGRSYDIQAHDTLADARQVEWKLPWLELIDDSRFKTQTRPSTLYASTARRNNSAEPQQAPSAVIPSKLAEKIRQDAQANLPGWTFLISFMPFAVVWNQTLMLP